MKDIQRASWLLPLFGSLAAFVVTFSILRYVNTKQPNEFPTSRTDRDPETSHVSQSLGTETYKDYVLHILQTRRSQPDRSPEDWMYFLASLDAWYRQSKTDCVSTLSSNGYGPILSIIEEACSRMANDELLAVARETNDSTVQFACWDELWRRTVPQGPQACAEFSSISPSVYKSIFQDRLIKMWVKEKGLKSLEEITASPHTNAKDFDEAFSLCVKENPNGCEEYLSEVNFQKLYDRFGDDLPQRDSLIRRVCRALPLERAFEILSKEPESAGRSASIRTIATAAVETNPELAATLMMQDPHLVPNVCRAAGAVALNKPKVAAEIINMVGGERLRTSVARKTALSLPPKEAEEFINALTEPLTRETVRAAVDQLQRRTPFNTKKQ